VRPVVEAQDGEEDHLLEFAWELFVTHVYFAGLMDARNVGHMSGWGKWPSPPPPTPTGGDLPPATAHCILSVSDYR
ncbi:MAG: hypothetical protein O7I93_13515, partial [Gemmatimonadetes bacterium]|nr:hypothetical protein [Gemmatimonadota bacterium]